MEDNHFEFEDVFEDLNDEEAMEKLSIEFMTEENESFHKLMRYLAWNCSGDFTEFVKILTFRLESKKKAVLIGLDDDDPKRVIVLNTLREIVKSYNATMEDYLKEIAVFE